MVTKTSRRAFGFTLVELLVVITIIGMLVALLLPAVQAVRATARKTECLSNMRQVGLAMINYESRKNKLPGYVQPVGRIETTGDKTWAVQETVPSSGTDGVIVGDTDIYSSTVSWAAMLLPELERQDLWDEIVNPALDSLQIRPVDVFLCPSDTDARANPNNAGLSFIVNSGQWDLVDMDDALDFKPGGDYLQDSQYNGIFHNLTTYSKPIMRLSINDGAGTTLMISENNNKEPEFTWFSGTEQQMGMTWIYDDDVMKTLNPADQYGINRGVDDVSSYPSNKSQFARPASQHTGGVNVIFADGRGTFLRDDIEYAVYHKLMTPNGRKASDIHNPNADGSANYIWDDSTDAALLAIDPPLSESDYQ